MKQLLQNMKNGKTTIADVPVPTPHAGQALVRVAASLVSAGTERMLVEFAEKSLLGKARSRPDLVRQVLDKMHREGVLATLVPPSTAWTSPCHWATPPPGHYRGAGRNGYGWVQGGPAGGLCGRRLCRSCRNTT